jgi:hypothetical protein
MVASAAARATTQTVRLGRAKERGVGSAIALAIDADVVGVERIRFAFVPRGRKS